LGAQDLQGSAMPDLYYRAKVEDYGRRGDNKKSRLSKSKRQISKNDAFAEHIQLIKRSQTEDYADGKMLVQTAQWFVTRHCGVSPYRPAHNKPDSSSQDKSMPTSQLGAVRECSVDGLSYG
jgi:hypothetical protein